MPGMLPDKNDKTIKNRYMQNKLQELTDKLYNEGLSKGKQEGEAVLAKARQDAGAIIENARKEAAAIISAAQKDADSLKAKTEGDIRLAASQSIAATRQALENLVTLRLAGKEVSSTLSSAAFVKEMLTAIVTSFNASDEATDLEMVLPESLRKEIEPFIRKELASMFKGGLEASFSKKIAGGFTVSPKGSGYFISLTDDTFNALISEYLRPATRRLLFGDEK